VLRFFAASSVLFAHLQHEVLASLPNDSGFKPFSLIDGGFGVDLFFVISGFIMYHVSADTFGQAGASREFLVRRYLRIAPLYYLATLLMLAATFTFSGSVSIGRPDLGHVLTSLLFIPSPNSLGQVVPVLKLGWTLNFEAYFYVVFALALSFRRRTGLAFLMLVLVSMVVLAQVLPQPPVAIAFWGQSIVFEFVGGIGVAMLYRRGLRLSAPAAWVVIGGSLLLLAGLRIGDVIPFLPRAIYAGVPAWLVVAAVVAAPFDERQSALKRFLVAGGEASYAIYVIHPFGIRAGTLIWNRMALRVEPWPYIALLMIVVIVSAFAVNLLVERPLDRWLRGLLNPSRRAPSPAAPQA
jgi:peptidoglycan/LPS O-acetylase OafA/YrhL